MSALGHEQTSRHVRVMSVIPLKADIHQRGLHVRYVPIADCVLRCCAGALLCTSMDRDGRLGESELGA